MLAISLAPLEVLLCIGYRLADEISCVNEDLRYLIKYVPMIRGQGVLNNQKMRRRSCQNSVQIESNSAIDNNIVQSSPIYSL